MSSLYKRADTVLCYSKGGWNVCHIKKEADAKGFP